MRTTHSLQLGDEVRDGSIGLAGGVMA